MPSQGGYAVVSLSCASAWIIKATVRLRDESKAIILACLQMALFITERAERFVKSRENS